MISFPTTDVSEIQKTIASYQATTCFLLYDEHTIRHCDSMIRRIFPHLNSARRIIIPSGDGNKSIQKAMVIWDALMAYQARKDALLVNVGGGMITDIGGFCAANFKRGIDFINVPTSLLGMIDASIGGKTGVNFRNSKNQIGVFAKPVATYLNIDFLQTLPKNELNSGIAEMVKHELLFNPNALELILSRPDSNKWITQKAIIKNIQYKYNCVKNDYFDKHERQTLNFGHTIGHAIESLSHQRKTPILHGEAVMLGMIAEMKIAEYLYNSPKEIRLLLETFKKKYFPFLNFRYRFEQIIPFLKQDKKNDATIRFSLIKRVAQPILKVGVDIETLKNELV